jgi:putative DNA primase/helicase
VTSRPVALAVNVAGIHEALQRERRWVMWKYILRDGRWTKVPFQVSGLPAKSDDPSTWTTFAHVCIAYQTGRFDGIGFVLGDGWAGIDVDHFVGHTWPLLEQQVGYRETSPSADGFKIIGRSDRIGGQINFAHEPPAFTTWSAARFFATTGHAAAGDPAADLSTFIDNWFREPVITLSSTREGYAGAAEIDDEALWCQMLGSGDERSDKILALFRGDTSAYSHDHSHADQALVNHLAWWTNFDKDRIDRMFQQSGLMRDKWKKATYRNATISKALR